MTSGSPLEIEMQRLIAELRLEYYCSFTTKLNDISAQIERLRQKPDDRAAMERLYEVVHRIHGTSGSFGFDQIAILCGDWENAMKGLREGLKTTPSPSQLDRMERYLSSLRNLVESDPCRPS